MVAEHTQWEGILEEWSDNSSQLCSTDLLDTVEPILRL